MKLTFLLLSLLAIVDMTVAKKHRGKHAEPRTQDWEATVQTALEGMDGKPTIEELSFAAQAWMDAYNTIHYDDSLQVETIQVEDYHQGHQRSLRPIRRFNIWNHVRFHCEFCWDDNWDRRLRKQSRVERLYCTMLRSGPYPVYHNLEDCRVVMVE